MMLINALAVDLHGVLMVSSEWHIDEACGPWFSSREGDSV